MQLQLRPGVLRAWRGPGRLQLGLGSGGVVLDGLTAAEGRLVEALDDGPLPADALSAAAADLGVSASRAQHLLDTLAGAGLMVGERTPRAQRAALPEHLRRSTNADAAVLGLAHRRGDGWDHLVERSKAAVVVAGASATGLSIAHGLAAAGVGRVFVEDDAPVFPADVSPGGYGDDDVGHPRGPRAAAHVRRRSPSTTTVPQVCGDAAPVRPDVVVLVAAGALDPCRTEALVREGVAHVPVLWRGTGTVVGPLVRPGRSTCVRCTDLHRADRDPQWPALVAQLCTRPPGGSARPEETSLAALTAALACVQVLAELDGVDVPAALDATLEVTLPTGAVHARPWTPHPRCGCTWGG